MALGVNPGGISSNAFLSLATDQLVNWLAQRLSFHIPEGNVYSTDRREGRSLAAMVLGRSKALLPNELGGEWVCSLQKDLKLILDRSQ